MVPYHGAGPLACDEVILPTDMGVGAASSPLRRNEGVAIQAIHASPAINSLSINASQACIASASQAIPASDAINQATPLPSTKTSLTPACHVPGTTADDVLQAIVEEPMY